MTYRHVVAVESFEQWRSAVRRLLEQDAEPHSVQWTSGIGPAAEDLFAADQVFARGQADGESVAELSCAQGKPPVQVPRGLMTLLQAASCFRAPDRWAFLYHVMWRWRCGEKEVMSAADPDGNRLHAMAKAVRREEHDMHAYVRFRERPPQDGPPRFVAWYEPAHDVLPQVARHFVHRMGGASWMIATPDASVLWNGETLHNTGPLMNGPADVVDDGEALWLTYYRSIFNPARLNTRVMQSHVPSRFWKNLPEGRLVPGMVAQAASGARRVGQAESVGGRAGAEISMSPELAMPQRAAPTALEQCRRCDLWRNATQAVKGVGPDVARIMLVGEQPGDQEDIAGQPFVGPAGQLLDQVLQQAGLDRGGVYLTNAVKHFKWEPRGKRRLHKTPGQREIVACRHWLQEELDRIRPTVVVALGSTALKSLTGMSAVSLADMLGKPFMQDGRWIIASYHPAYALRTPDEVVRQNALDAMADALHQAKQLSLTPP